MLLKCIHTLPRHSRSNVLVFKLLTKPKRLLHSNTNKESNKPAFFSSTETSSPILTELVYGRKRIYTSLQSIGKSKSSTASRPYIASPVTSSPLSWEWDQSSEDSHPNKKREWYQLKTKKGGSSAINTVKQNMREMFLPVGYPEAVHDCYKKFHMWLFLETYVGSSVCVFNYKNVICELI